MLTSIFDDLYTINRTINKMFTNYPDYRQGSWPETNVYENNKEYVIVAKVPGVKKQEIKLHIKDNALHLSGEKKKEKLENANYHLNERNEGQFERSFLLGEKINTDNMEAELKNGLLIVKLPKTPEAKPKTIEIK